MKLSSRYFQLGILVKLFKTLIQIKRVYRQSWILKICGDIINKLLELIFKQAPITDKYLSDWKKGNIVSSQ